MIRTAILLQFVLLLSCSTSPNKTDRVTKPEKPKPRLVVQTDTSQIDTSQISRMTLSEAVATLGKPFEREDYNFPEANAAGLREGLTQYIPIDSKQQYRIRQLTWKRGKYRTTVFYWYATGNWRPLYWYSWEDGMVF